MFLFIRFNLYVDIIVSLLTKSDRFSIYEIHFQEDFITPCHVYVFDFSETAVFATGESNFVDI